jgi:pimeloyl-ACP methyl ester carboxylesterase
MTGAGPIPPAGFRRRFVDVAHGQMHVRMSGDPELPALVMCHAAPHTSFYMLPLAAHFAGKRRLVLIDTAGTGDSAALPGEEITVADLAAAHWQVVEALGLGTVDLYGAHTGASICVELSIAHGRRIGRIVMDGLSVFTPAERSNLLDHVHAPVITPDVHGSQLTTAWSMTRNSWLFWPWWDSRHAARRPLDLPSPEYLHDETVEFLKGCKTYHRNYNAGIRYPKQERLPLVRNPVLLTAAPSDTFHDQLERGVGIIPGAIAAVTPERDGDGGSEAAAIMLRFLDG